MRATDKVGESFSGENIRLSEDRTEAELTALYDTWCFANRPLRRGEDVVLTIGGSRTGYYCIIQASFLDFHSENETDDFHV